MDSEYTIISAKNNAQLLRKKSDNLSYRVLFSIRHNKPLNPSDHIGFDTYPILHRVNQDIIDDISLESVRDEPNSRFVLMQIKPMGESFIKGKYIVTKVSLIAPSDSSCAGLVGSTVPVSQTNFVPNPRYEELHCTQSNLFVFWNEDSSSLVIQYDFTLVDPSFAAKGLQIPRAVSDISALMIKKVFLRMKEFKENELSSTTY